MKRKSIIALILTGILIVPLSIAGCGNTSRTKTGNNLTDTRENTIRNDVNNAAESTRERMESATDSLRYDTAKFRNDISNAGYKLKESLNTKKNYFKGNETNYLLGGDLVRLYEYNSPTDLEGDINRISSNGRTITGTNANYKASPYYYRKGNTLIMYEGKEPAYIDEFNRLYGTAIRP